MPSSTQELHDLLDLEPLEVGLFRGQQASHTDLKRVYGGQVAAQALVAAQATVPAERAVHSLHLYFVLGGDTSIPIIYDVEKVRDGRSFTTRRVAARQHGEIIFYMTASFQKPETGWTHQDAMPQVPDPDDCMPVDKVLDVIDPAAGEHWRKEWSATEMRYIGDNREAADPQRHSNPAVQRLWFKTRETIGDSQALHNAVLTYLSDLTLLGASLLPHGLHIGDPRVQPASLDHTIWFHRPFRADDWLLYDQHSPSASGARGLSLARVFNRAGDLVATIAQEGLIRPIDPQDARL